MKCPICQQKIKVSVHQECKCPSCQNHFKIKINKFRFLMVMALVLIVSNICDAIAVLFNLSFVVRLMMLCLLLGLFYYIYQLTDMDRWIMRFEKVDDMHSSLDDSSEVTTQ